MNNSGKDKLIFVIARNYKVFKYFMDLKFDELRISGSTDLFQHNSGTTTFTHVEKGVITRYKYFNEHSTRGQRPDGVRIVMPMEVETDGPMDRAVAELRHRLNMTPDEFFAAENKWYDPNTPEGIAQRRLSVFGELGD